jgi:hypothetical protein
LLARFLREEALYGSGFAHFLQDNVPSIQTHESNSNRPSKHPFILSLEGSSSFSIQPSIFGRLPNSLLHPPGAIYYKLELRIIVRVGANLEAPKK